ncbi:MarR family transcriptional regulator [Paraburkholderia nemoris]|uniref:MarR family transcriptional regulator n=1 Tax=Paraburkholderia nemoris TaxID=2793076 RepID=UPI002E2CE5DD|nr:MarR family transcriptional regulator [Paraburkholderia nemoris]
MVMLALWGHDGITLRTVAERVFLDSATLTLLLKRLEAAGRINRSHESTDERQVLITRGEDGRALKAAVAIISTTALRATGINRQSFEQLRVDLIQLRRSLDIAI